MIDEAEEMRKSRLLSDHVDRVTRTVAGSLSPEPLPGVETLLGLEDPVSAARARWEWGEKYLADEDKLEENPALDPVHKALEELWDFINYANEAIRQERCSNLMKGCRDEILPIVHRIRDACLRGESVARRSSTIP